MQKKTYLDFSLKRPLPRRLEQNRLTQPEIDTVLDGAYCVKSVENVGMEFQGENPIKRIIEAQLQKIALNEKKVKDKNTKLRKKLGKIPFKELEDAQI